MFSQEIIDTYALGDISDYDSELDYYYSFLAKTDHIPNKIIIISYIFFFIIIIRS